MAKTREVRVVVAGSVAEPLTMTAMTWKPLFFDDEVETVTITDACDILEAWKAVDTEHRNYRWGGTDDEDEPVHVAWVTDRGTLEMETAEGGADGQFVLGALLDSFAAAHVVVEEVQ